MSVPLPSAIVFSRELTIARFSSSVRVGAPTNVVSYRFLNVASFWLSSPRWRARSTAGTSGLLSIRDAGLPGSGLPAVVAIHRLLDSVLHHGKDRLGGPLDHSLRRFALVRKEALQHVV